VLISTHFTLCIRDIVSLDLLVVCTKCFSCDVKNIEYLHIFNK